MTKNLILDLILANLAQIPPTPLKLFSWVLPPLDVKHCDKLSSYSISKKPYDSKSIKRQKISFWAQIRAGNFFYKTSS